MTVICIGGVCIPLTAVIPAVLLFLKAAYSRCCARRDKGSAASDAAAKKTDAPQPDVPAGKSDSAAGAGGSSSSAGPGAPGTSPREVFEVATPEEFDEHLASADAAGEPVFVNFGAPWCKPCKAIHPTFVSLAGTHGAALYLKVDVDLLQDVADRYKIKMLPTLVVFRRRVEAERTTPTSSAVLTEFVTRHLASR